MTRCLGLKHIAFGSAAFLLLTAAAPGASAQWVVGAGYQYRAGAPTSGLSFHVERRGATPVSWIHLFARGQAAYFFKETTYAPGFGAVPGGWVRGYDAALSIGVGASWEPVGFYAGVGGGYERAVERRTSEGLTDPRAARAFSPTRHRAADRYLLRYAGVSLHPFNRVLLYAERQWPHYANQTSPSEIPLRKNAVGVSVRF